MYSSSSHTCKTTKDIDSSQLRKTKIHTALSSYKLWICCGLSVCFGLVFFISLAVQRQQDEVSNTSSEYSVSVATTTLRPVSSYEDTRTYTGTVTSSRTSALGFERGGIVTELKVEKGDWIESGQILASLDARDLEFQRQQLIAQRDQAFSKLQELQTGPRNETIAAVQSEVQDYQEQFKLASIKYDRRQSLYEKGAISREDFDESRTQREILTARIGTSQSNLDALLSGTREEQVAAQQAKIRQLDAALSNVELDIEKSILTAPFAGQIITQEASKGTILAAGQIIYRLIDKSQLKAEIGLPIAIAEQLAVGEKTFLRAHNRKYEAVISAVLSEINLPTRTVPVVFDIDADDKAIIGQSVQFDFLQSHKMPPESYWLPTEALLQSTGGIWSVYTLSPQSSSSVEMVNSSLYEVERAEVEVIDINGDQILVRGTLSVGDQVITAAPERVVPGQLVRGRYP